RRPPGPALTAGPAVGDTGIEPVTSSVSGKRATAAPIARARWVRDSNPCIRLCRPLPRLSANPPCDPVSQCRQCCQVLSDTPRWIPCWATDLERTTGLEPATLTLAR